jgi:hypothetical protein
MTTIIIILSCLYWAVIAVVYGIAEAYYFFHLNQCYDKRGRNHDHAYLTMMRMLTALPIYAILIMQGISYWMIFLFIIYQTLVFPFLHDGTYFMTRNAIHPGTYMDGWRHYENSRAMFDLTYKERVCGLLIAFMVFTAMMALTYIERRAV